MNQSNTKSEANQPEMRNTKNFIMGIGSISAGIVLISSGINPVMQRNVKADKKPALPNFVFILADDLGWSDLGCYGSRLYETPAIDRLASDGIRFSNAYAACHVSSPTRASILTGQYPARLQLTDWLPGRKDFPFQKLLNVQSAQHLPYLQQNTFPSILRDYGYATAIIGKWHLGEDSASCERQGFNSHIPSGWLKGWPARSYFSPYQMPGLEDGPEGEYLTDRLTDEALHFITSNKEKPFLLYLSHFAVHDPVQGRPDLVIKYEQKLKISKQLGNTPFILEGNPDELKAVPAKEKSGKLPEYVGFRVFPNRFVKIKQTQDNVQFAAMVESLDQSVGRVLDKLTELNIEKNTIIIFVSDNGGMSAANFGNPNRVIQENNLDRAYSTSNLPLRGGKGWLYEGGIRVPLIIKWPGHGDKGSVCDIPVITTDFFSTIMEMSGLPVNHKHNDGISLVKLIEGRKDKNISNRAIYWHFPHYSNHGMQSPGGAIRFGDFKLIEYFENNTIQLFNIKTDPGEKHDLSMSSPEKAAKLRNMLHKWRVETNSQLMKPNENYDPSLTIN